MGYDIRITQGEFCSEGEIMVERGRLSEMPNPIRLMPLFAFFLLTLMTMPQAMAESPAIPAPPPTDRDDVVDTLHGLTLADPYRWLEDQNSPKTRAWIDAQDQYTDSLLEKIPGREAVEQRLSSLMKQDQITAPLVRHGRYFYMQRLATQDLFVIYLREGLNGASQALVDPHPMSADHSTSVSLETVSRDGKLMVYGVRLGGQDEVGLHFFDVDARHDLPDILPHARYSGVAILPDRTGVYYVRQAAQGPRVYYHRMGANPQADTLIFGQGFGPGDIMGVDLTEDGRYLMITELHGAAPRKTEIYLQDLAAHGPVKPLVNDLDAKFFGTLGGDQLFLQTDWKAPRGRVLSVSLASPQRDHWQEIIPEGKGVIDNVSAVGGHLFVNYVEDVSSHLRVFTPQGRLVHQVAFPVMGTAGGVHGEWGGNEAFFEFNSFAVPPTIYRYGLADNRQSVWARVSVPVDPEKIDLSQVWYTSKDGTRIPMFLLRLKSVKPNGALPALLTAYGGFDLSLTPTFSPRAVAFVEQGGVFALANLRGGGEFGEAWHQAGMLGKKQNVFDDFIGAAEWLVANHYTNPSRLAITGASNGGLLMGAMITQRPDLFRAVDCRYPLLDMIRYQDFLVARFWVPEYGSAEDARQFKYLLAYSPYQNVKKGVAYPSVLFVTGDGDTRVAPLHARKMTAMLQWASSDLQQRPVLLLYDTKSGHSGGRPLSKDIEEGTQELMYLYWQLGVEVQ